MNFSNLLGSEKYSDMTIKCTVDDSTFPVHRAIICQSPVFESICNSGLKESETRIIENTTIRGRVMSCLLYFLYTGNLDITQTKPEFNESNAAPLSFFHPRQNSRSEAREDEGSLVQLVTESEQQEDAVVTSLIDLLTIYRDLWVAADFYLVPTLQDAIAAQLVDFIENKLEESYDPSKSPLYWKALADISEIGQHLSLGAAISEAISRNRGQIILEKLIPEIRILLCGQNGETSRCLWQKVECSKKNHDNCIVAKRLKRVECSGCHKFLAIRFRCINNSCRMGVSETNDPWEYV